MIRLESTALPVTMSRMMKCVVVALASLLALCLEGAEFALVTIGYTGPGPQGTYLLPQGKDGLFSLKPIGESPKLSDVRVEGIAPALEKAYPSLVGEVSAVGISIDTGKLAADGKIHVLGQVEHAGEYPADSLAACVAAAKPTPFGAVIRIQVIRKGKSYSYDLKKKADADIRLEPGDIVHLPMKRLFGS